MIHERVDDLPLLLAEMQRLGLPALLDAHFPTHGNWDGLSLGEMLTVWLTHVLSTSNHCLSHVQPWAAAHWRTLAAGLGHPFPATDLSDDRLAAGLRYLSRDTPWQDFEVALNQRSLRVYHLAAARVRLDSTTVRSYQSPAPDGLFQFGHSKGTPRLPILKVMAATLDPLQFPLVTTVLPGHHADDPLYVPAIHAVRRSLDQPGVLFCGDSKMGALDTRAYVARGHDFYLCPLGEKQLSPAALDTLLLPVWAETQALTPVYRPEPDGTPLLLATGFEVTEPLVVGAGADACRWNERRLVIRSEQWAAQARASLQQRVEKACQAIAALGERGRGKRRFSDLPTLQQAVAQLLTRYQVPDLLQLTYSSETQTRTIRRRGSQPERVVQESTVGVTVAVDPVALAAAERRLGWRVYATNASDTQLTLAEAVKAYREQYQIEHSFGRLKGRSLSLQPMYLARDEHATGLVRLLSLGLRVLSLLEFQVRRGLAARETALAGLYPGNPTRATTRPTTELLLRSFGQITLTLLPAGDQPQRYLTALTPLQKQLLQLLELPETIYTQIVDRFDDPG